MSAVEPLELNGIWKGKTQDAKGPNDKSPEYATCSETGLDGPDQVLFADRDTSTEIDKPVRVKIDLCTNPPISLPGMLMKTAKKYPDRLALVSRPEDDGRRKTYTYKEYEAEVRIVAKAFLKLGLERHHGVSIMGFNSPRWFISHLASMFAGGLSAGIYTTNTPEACLHCARTAKANIIVVEDDGQLEKILKIKDGLPFLKAIVQYDGVPKTKGVLSWEELLEIGKKESDDKLDAVLRRIGVNECCALVFTSGTVGDPKAVMLNHDNFVTASKACFTAFKLFGTETHMSTISYLPLSHIAAQTIDIVSFILLGGTIYFADRNVLKGTLVEALKNNRPNLFVGVPRVWEKIAEKIQEAGRNSGVIKRWISSWARSQALYYHTNRLNGVDYKNWGYLIAKWLVLNRVKAMLGMDKCEFLGSGAAPLNMEVQQFFLSLDMRILNVYGLSESGGPHFGCTNDVWRFQTMGKTFPFLQTQIHNPNENGEGELWLKGRNIFMGYLNEPEKTKEVFVDGGWFRTGDLARCDKDGFIHGTGRIKEIIITSGGENIPPIRIECTILSELPALSNVLLVGDQRKYLTVLVSLKSDIEPTTGKPLDTLSPEVLSWASSIGSTSKTVSEVVKTKDKRIHDEIDKAIQRANTKAISNAQRVQKFRILPNDFSIATGELGPTLKIKRSFILKKYADLIEEMYE